MLADVALIVTKHTNQPPRMDLPHRHQQSQPWLLAESSSLTTAECMPVFSWSQLSNLRKQTPLCTNCSISSFSLRAETLCRSYRSLLSSPKPPLLQDSQYCVLEFVRACGCSCAFSSMVPVKKMMPFIGLKCIWSRGKTLQRLWCFLKMTLAHS